MSSSNSRRPWIVRLARVGLAAAATLALVALTTRGASGDPGDPGDDGVPWGTMAYFTGGACPTGWVPADNVAGRLVVAVGDGANGGIQVGVPMKDREDRAHTHDYAGQVDLPDKAIAGADGANDQGAEKKTYSLAGTTAPSGSGYGFVQVQACVKQ
jgi:hypothetical protein